MFDPYQKWPGFSDNLTLIINVDKSEFGIRHGAIDFDGRPFRPKQETHITVLGTAPVSSLLEKIQQDPGVEGVLIRAFEQTDWSYTVTADYRHLVRPATGGESAGTTEESIIVLVEMEGMARFYAILKKLALVDSDLPVPPPHVTLYTFNCDTGIGVPSDGDLDTLTHRRIGKPP
jgi:hypothetical protein